MAGSEAQQTRSRRAEQTAEVVRNHEGGTGCRRVAPSARTRDRSRQPERFGALACPGPGGVDARTVVSAKGNEADESHERRSPWPRPSGLLADRAARVARGSSRRASALKGRPEGAVVDARWLAHRADGGRGNASRARPATAQGRGGARGRPTTRYLARRRGTRDSSCDRRSLEVHEVQVNPTRASRSGLAPPESLTGSIL
jgi:hypothetical protein